MDDEERPPGPETWSEPLKDAVTLLSRKKGGVRYPPLRKCAVKQCAELGTKKVTYIRGRDYVFTTQRFRFNHPVYLKVFSKALGKDLTEITPEISVELIELLLKQKIVSKAKWVPMGANSKPPKWPQRIERVGHGPPPSLTDTFEEDNYYIFNYEKPHPYWRLLVAATIGVPVLVVLFPVWPLWIKIALWYAALGFLLLIFGLTLLRLTIFIPIWIGGYEFWIFPNLFDDTIPYYEAFKPLWAFYRTEEDEGFLIMRAILLLLGYVSCHEIARQGWELEDVTAPFYEVRDWGLNKLAPPEHMQRLQLPSLADLMQDDGDGSAGSAGAAESGAAKTADGGDGSDGGSWRDVADATVEQEPSLFDEEL